LFRRQRPKVRHSVRLDQRVPGFHPLRDDLSVDPPPAVRIRDPLLENDVLHHGFGQLGISVHQAAETVVDCQDLELMHPTHQLTPYLFRVQAHCDLSKQVVRGEHFLRADVDDSRRFHRLREAPAHRLRFQAMNHF
ncbi:hypothetical protein EGW08_020897, partial [Elysia chlorotica]